MNVPITPGFVGPASPKEHWYANLCQTCQVNLAGLELPRVILLIACKKRLASVLAGRFANLSRESKLLEAITQLWKVFASTLERAYPVWAQMS